MIRFGQNQHLASPKTLDFLYSYALYCCYWSSLYVLHLCIPGTGNQSTNSFQSKINAPVVVVVDFTSALLINLLAVTAASVFFIAISPTITHLDDSFGIFSFLLFLNTCQISFSFFYRLNALEYEVIINHWSMQWLRTAQKIAYRLNKAVICK